MSPARIVAKARGDWQSHSAGKGGMPTDDQLLVAALAGSGREAALAECIRRFGPMIRRTAWRITSDEHRADDVCQAVFLVLLRKAARVASHPSPSAWLYYVTVTIARDAVKSEARRQRREQEAVMVAQSQRKPLTRLPTGLDQAIVRLPEIYRRVLVAHYLEGHSHAAVAAQLGVSEEIVRKRASRGIERLRKSLVGTALGSVTVAGLAGLLSAEAAAAAPLAAAQVAAIQAAVAGAASVQVAALAAAGAKALLWAKVKVYALIMASVAVVAVPVYVALQPSESGTYSTNFPRTENPISENGVWVRGGVEGLDWNNPKTASAHATASVVASRYNDCIAHLNRPGFNADQYAQGTVYLANGYMGNGGKHAVELLLRFSISGHNARGYEVLWGTSGEIAIVRWNGPPGNFTSLWSGPALKPVDGDVLRAEIAGRVISVYRNGSRVTTIDVASQGGTVWSSGQPGIGFWPVDGAIPDNLGWKNFQAGNLK